MGDGSIAHALQSFDRLYPQASGESPLQQLQIQLANAVPYDLEDTEPGEYKSLDPRWHGWNAIEATGSHGATVSLVGCGTGRAGWGLPAGPAGPGPQGAM